jgi:hypothetical protein
MAWQGGQVQLEQSHMHLVLNMAKKATAGFLARHTQYLIKNPYAEVQDEKKHDVMFPGYIIVKAATQRHPALVLDNLMDGCPRFQNGTANTPQTCQRWKGTATPSPQPIQSL